MSKNGGKVKIDSDSWFPSTLPETSGKREIVELPIDDFYPFKNHPFKIRDDPEMLELVESVKRTGRIIQPVIARPREGKTGVETIAGHRRLQALIMAGLETAPAIVEPMDDDTATIIMVDTNLGQRTHLLFSEKAFAYRMKLEALNHQGERNDLTSVGNQQKLTSRQIVASDAKVKESEVQQYIRLTYLIEPLLDKVDYKELLFTPAVDISYLKNEEQIWVGCALEKYGGLTTKQSALIKQMSKEGTLTESAIEAIMRTEQPLDMKVTLKGQTLQKYFPKDYTPKQMQEVIINLLEGWKKEHQRDDMKLVR